MSENKLSRLSVSMTVLENEIACTCQKITKKAKRQGDGSRGSESGGDKDRQLEIVTSTPSRSKVILVNGCRTETSIIVRLHQPLTSLDLGQRGRGRLVNKQCVSVCVCVCLCVCVCDRGRVLCLCLWVDECSGEEDTVMSD